MAVKPDPDGGKAAGLNNLAAAARAAGSRGLPPVHLWDPPYCGDIGLRIGRDGTWYYQNSPIGRPALVKLFASILRKDRAKDLDRHVLVTPVEKVAVEVEDAPFLAVQLVVEDGKLNFRTNVDDWVSADREHPLRFEPGPSDGIKPYVLVRGGLWALVARSVYYDLVERGETRILEGRPMFGVASGDEFFAIAPADEKEGSA
ncbi:DUF1285 domain-containing protein [Roseiarcaceae bacterium H3SJ34-1]|uniref:DUF1285 domain-containing protein n=1 Tax=Terripilifer ovatus TaxID=3032367 RepID=UPI003AB983D4|nr:DUF1285 domain-containing protein [Roseiarcaceae bacterium H3SJ34-1]